jgi:hypothetical protein
MMRLAQNALTPHTNLAASLCDGGRGTLVRGYCARTSFTTDDIANTDDLYQYACDYYKIMFWCTNRNLPQCYLDEYHELYCPIFEQSFELIQCDADCADSSMLSLAFALVSSLL